jgi:autophagy-related protein 5
MATPLRLVLHLASPPTDKLLLSPSAESCKQAFMGQLKEADFIRWGNTKRMTGLRKAEQDGIWEGVKERESPMIRHVSISIQRPNIYFLSLDNFDDYWRVASKVTPTTAPTRPQSPGPPPSSASMHNRPPSADSAGPPDRDGAYNVRSVPVRVYLPDGPVLQDLVPPVLEDGKWIFCLGPRVNDVSGYNLHLIWECRYTMC